MSSSADVKFFESFANTKTKNYKEGKVAHICTHVKSKDRDRANLMQETASNS